MDDRDRSILRHLQEEGRISNIHLSKRIHLSPPQTLMRTPGVASVRSNVCMEKSNP
jgi:DNA-binding Lrp family transcriptional regulator